MSCKRAIILNAVACGWIAFLSITGVFVTVRQFVIIERQNRSIQVNEQQTAHIHDIEVRLREMEAKTCRP